jgi:hypothetical protein
MSKQLTNKPQIGGHQEVLESVQEQFPDFPPASQQSFADYLMQRVQLIIESESKSS